MILLFEFLVLLSLLLVGLLKRAAVEQLSLKLLQAAFVVGFTLFEAHAALVIFVYLLEDPRFQLLIFLHEQLFFLVVLAQQLYYVVLVGVPASFLDPQHQIQILFPRVSAPIIQHNTSLVAHRVGAAFIRNHEGP